MNNKAEILTQALAAIERETGIRIEIALREIAREGHIVDAFLEIDGDQYDAAIKAWAQHAPIGPTIELVKRYPNGLLVADYVNPKMADQLRNAAVQFIDTAGNAFIQTHQHHIWVKGNKKPNAREGAKKPKRLKAFTPTGLRVTYALLCNPRLIERPYRDIADETGVALGTIGGVFDDLAWAGYMTRTKNRRKLNNVEKILDVWVERYPAVLRPKLLQGTFKTRTERWWQNIDINEFEGEWGGELAGMHYTDYLRPEIATLYIPKQMLMKFIATARLQKEKGEEAVNVEILTHFWRTTIQDEYVHPVLAYADLIATGNARNLDTARMLYDKQITQHFREAGFDFN